MGGGGDFVIRDVHGLDIQESFSWAHSLIWNLGGTSGVRAHHACYQERVSASPGELGREQKKRGDNR